MTGHQHGGRTAQRRRLAAVPALVGIAFLLAAPLGTAPATAATAADSQMTVQIDSPTGQSVSDATAVNVSGSVNSGFGPTVDGIHIVVTRNSDGAMVLDTTVCCNPGKSGVIPFSAATPSLSVNGSYKVVVTATGYTELLLARPAVDPASATASFKMAIPPAAPANTKVDVQGDRSVIVSWSAVPAYSDFVGYAIYRKTGSAPFQPVKGIEDRTTTSFHDTSLGAFSGPIQYQVASIRGVKGDESTWLISTGDAAAATVPPPPTTTPPATGPDGSTTTTKPGGGLQQGGAASADLGGFFSAQPQPIPLPPASPPPTFPDTGYSETLPFGALPSTTDAPGKVSGRSTGKSSSASGSGEVDNGQLAGVNRRALLVPIAAGSVLCVAALHLRWLNRRLAMPPAGGAAAGSPAGGDLQVDVDHPGDGAFRPESAAPAKEPVGASW